MAVKPLIATVILNKAHVLKSQGITACSSFSCYAFSLCCVSGSDISLIFKSKNKACLSFGCAQSGVSLITSISCLNFTGALNGPVNTQGLLSSVTAIKPDTSWGWGCRVISWLELVWCRYSCVDFAIRPKLNLTCTGPHEQIPRKHPVFNFKGFFFKVKSTQSQIIILDHKP